MPKPRKGAIAPHHRRPPPARPAGPARAFAEFDAVRLTRDFGTPDGVVPAGTEATVLVVLDGGRAYHVEFAGAHEVPENVPADALESRVARPAEQR